MLTWWSSKRSKHNDGTPIPTRVVAINARQHGDASGSKQLLVPSVESVRTLVFHTNNGDMKVELTEDNRERIKVAGVTRIQKIVRGIKGRKKFKKMSAVRTVQKIHKIYLGYKTRKQFSPFLDYFLGKQAPEGYPPQRNA